jgi:hypothetical protein
MVQSLDPDTIVFSDPDPFKQIIYDPGGSGTAPQHWSQLPSED